MTEPGPHCNQMFQRLEHKQKNVGPSTTLITNPLLPGALMVDDGSPYLATKSVRVRGSPSKMCFQGLASVAGEPAGVAGAVAGVEGAAAGGVDAVPCSFSKLLSSFFHSADLSGSPRNFCRTSLGMVNFPSTSLHTSKSGGVTVSGRPGESGTYLAPLIIPESLFHSSSRWLRKSFDASLWHAKSMVRPITGHESCTAAFSQAAS